ncbi:hypothetical protein CC1G_09234 [Coprinopsis cinerea okayama7|uniref:Transcription factor TFIIIC triple barrel domain-containing protein n=1 Tax=Coprinopsis cinerea (strain Okayama-7 / 130 / ATCC MYA-4618 / FGSC 9003) TaxID=240176 RepID=A8P515_COPC7|nr:hypothetical protein CC1G_09234 [Coprinopsis cinerea okayama7\|eukprot:XP_001838857.1 hypothetical protein CC1G_09234 [Coprinopsis cinerea okayama7\
MSSTPLQSLVPGYIQVEDFGDSDEYEDEEEISYVTLDLGTVEPTLVPSASSYYLILQGTVLKGRHNHLLGTELVFSENPDPQERSKRPVHHIANTEQRILFKEVTLEPKSPESNKDDKGASRKDGGGVEQDSQKIDRMTGRVAPPTRAPRTRGKKKNKEKEKAAEPETQASGSQPDDHQEGGHDTEDAMDVVQD